MNDGQLGKALLEHLPDAAFLVDGQGGILEANAAAYQLLGLASGKLEGRGMREVSVCPEDSFQAEEFTVSWWKDLPEGETRKAEILLRRSDGVFLPAEVHAVACAGGLQPRILGVLRENGRRTDRLQELRRRQAMLQAALQAGGDGVMVLDVRGCVQFANERLVEMWRLPQTLLQAGDDQSCFELFRDDLNDPRALEPMLHDNASRKVDLDLVHFKDGRIFERYASPLLDDGVVQGRLWSFRDITEEKWTEIALRESELRYRTLFDQAMDMIVVADAETGAIIDCNKAAERMTGRPCKELVGLHQSVLHPPQELRNEGFSKTFLQHRDEYGGQFLEAQVQDAQGNVRDVVIKANMLELGGRRFMQGIFHDVTEYKRIQLALASANDELELRVAQRTEELVASETRFRALVESSSDWIWELDADGRYVFVSPKVQRILGYNPQEMLGRRLSDMLDPAPQAAGLANGNTDPDDLEQRISQGQSYQALEYAVLHKDGGTVVLESSGLPVTDDQGAVVGFRGVDRDITERRRAEVELRLAKTRAEESNAAKSRFLSSVTHELKTPINAVMGMSELLDAAGLDEEQHEYLGHLRQATSRLLRIVNDILDYTRLEQSPEREATAPMELRNFFTALLRTFEAPTREKGLELALQLPHDLPPVLVGHWLLLQRTLEHLLDNAVKFTDAGSVTLAVATTSQDACFGLAAPSGGKAAGGLPCETVLHVTVRDSGPGIPAALQERIFEAFFQADGELSRKKGGTGIGLAVCLRSVQLMGGRLWVESQPGKGSVFNVAAPFSLPRNDDNA